MLFSFQIFYTSLFVEHEDPVPLTLIQMATATFLGLILLLFQGQVAIPMEREVILSLFYLGIFSTTLAFLIQTVAQKYTTETKNAIILSTEAFWGMVLSVIILHEVMTPSMIIGGILIFLPSSPQRPS